MNASQKSFWSGMRQAVSVTLILLFLCGFAFPVVLTGISSVVFPWQAGGSLVEADGQVIGATHVGQEFTKDCFMKGRPSAYHYNTYTEDANGNRYYSGGTEFGGLASGSSNYAPSNPALVERVEADMEAFLAANPGLSREDLPADLMTASGSGLDPHISPEAAAIQIPGLAKATGLSQEELTQIVADNTQGKLPGIFGERTVNVLGVNVQIARAMGMLAQDGE